MNERINQQTNGDIMKDIEKMKRDQARELELAIVGNEFEEATGTPCNAFESQGRVIISAHVDAAAVGRVLQSYGADGDILLNDIAGGQKEMDKRYAQYRLTLHHDFGCRRDELRIEYSHKFQTIWLTIDDIRETIEQKPELGDFIRHSRRELSSSELMTYKPTDERGRVVQRLEIPCLGWAVTLRRDVQHYIGGYATLLHKEMIRDFMGTIVG